MSGMTDQVIIEVSRSVRGRDPAFSVTSPRATINLPGERPAVAAR